MPKLTIYIDEPTERRLKRAAKTDHLSPSKWVREKLAKSLRTTWPDGYFDLFGSLAGEQFERPKQGDCRDDAPRGSL